MSSNLSGISMSPSPSGCEAPSFEALSQSMSRMGLGEISQDTQNLFIPSNTQVSTVKDLMDISPAFQEMFNKTIGLAILGEVRRFARRIKEAYRG